MRKPRVKFDRTEHCDRWIDIYYCSKCKFVVKPETKECPKCKTLLKPYKINRGS